MGTGGEIIVDTCNRETMFDTTLAVFSGSCARLSCIASDDDGCGNSSSVTWDSVAGVQYLVLVSGFESEVGRFKLTVTHREKFDRAGS